MFDMFDNLFLESNFDDSGVVLTEMESGFMWADCQTESTMDVDPFDFITEAMYANVVNANRLEYAILKEKYDYLVENGVEMISEGVSKEGVKEFFNKATEKIKAFYDAVVAKMVELQAKFRMLFEKGQKRAELGMPKVNMTVPVYTPSDVSSKTIESLNAVKKNAKDGDARVAETIKIDVESEKAADFKEELDILKNYGSYIKDIKKARNAALQALKEGEKKAVDDIKSWATRGQIKGEKENWKVCANVVFKVSKAGTHLIMSRVNAAAKVINAGFKSNKPEKKDKKSEKKVINAAATESTNFNFI